MSKLVSALTRNKRLQLGGGVVPSAVPDVRVNIPGDCDAAVSKKLLGVLVWDACLI